jgi:hypothetical protein
LGQNEKVNGTITLSNYYFDDLDAEAPYTLWQELGECFFDSYLNELAEVVGKVQVQLLARQATQVKREPRGARYQKVDPNTNANATGNKNNANSPSPSLSPVATPTKTIGSLREQRAKSKRDDVVGIIATKLKEMAAVEKELYLEAYPPKPKTPNGRDEKRAAKKAPMESKDDLSSSAQNQQHPASDSTVSAMAHMLPISKSGSGKSAKSTTATKTTTATTTSTTTTTASSSSVNNSRSLKSSGGGESDRETLRGSGGRRDATFNQSVGVAQLSTNPQAVVLTVNHLIGILIGLVAILIGVIVLKF